MESNFLDGATRHNLDSGFHSASYPDRFTHSTMTPADAQLSDRSYANHLPSSSRLLKNPGITNNGASSSIAERRQGVGNLPRFSLTASCSASIMDFQAQDDTVNASLKKSCRNAHYGNPARCGIFLKDALHSGTSKLHNQDKPVFEDRGPSVSIRLEWPGYRKWSRQIPIKDFRTIPSSPMTLGRLATRVAKCVQRFIQERKSIPMGDESDQRWMVVAISS